MPFALALILAVGIVITNYICALAGLTSTSRMMFAFARDGGLPASKFLSHISPQYRTPTYAIWTGAVLAFVTSLTGIIGSALGLKGVDIFLVLATGCAVFLYISYAIPVLAGFFGRGQNLEGKGPVQFGRLVQAHCACLRLRCGAFGNHRFLPAQRNSFLSHHCDGDHPADPLVCRL